MKEGIPFQPRRKLSFNDINRWDLCVHQLRCTITQSTNNLNVGDFHLLTLQGFHTFLNAAFLAEQFSGRTLCMYTSSCRSTVLVEYSTSLGERRRIERFNVTIAQVYIDVLSRGITELTFKYFKRCRDYELITKFKSEMLKTTNYTSETSHFFVSACFSMLLFHNKCCHVF